MKDELSLSMHSCWFVGCLGYCCVLSPFPPPFSSSSSSPPLLLPSSSPLMSAAAASSHPLSPSSDELPLDPPQCSIWFEPKQWSKRYADTFFTASVDGYSMEGGEGVLLIRLASGSRNQWTVNKSIKEVEEFCKEV